jgi:hypothetical protein
MKVGCFGGLLVPQEPERNMLQPRLDYHYLQPFLIWAGATGCFFSFPSQATDNYLSIRIQYNFWPTYCEGVGTWAS